MQKLIVIGVILAGWNFTVLSYAQGADRAQSADTEPAKTTNSHPVSGDPFNGADKKRIKEFQKRADAVRKIFNSSPKDWDAFEKGARSKLKDFPELAPCDIVGSAYADFELLIDHYYYGKTSDPGRAQALAREILASPAPGHYRLQASGFLGRLDAVGKPLVIQFTAMDGRQVDTSRMSGKVVLVDFWATHCPGCVADTPGLKALYDKLHGQGLEIVGVSSDDDLKKLQRFLKKEKIPWPQFFGKPEEGPNKLFQQFGVYGIPHIMLIDKKGVLRFDLVQADSDLEKEISKLIQE